MLYGFQIPTFNIETVVDKNATFYCEFVDLKRNGYHHFTKAINNLTYDFWRPWLDITDKNVTLYADSLKKVIKYKIT